MRILSIAVILSCSLTLQANYYVSIGDNSDVNNSIVSTGGGNNYYNKSLNEVISDTSYSTDPLLKGFVYMLKKYQQNQLTGQGHVDAFRQIKANTPYANISLKVSIFDGTNGIIFLDVISGTKRFQTFTPMSIQNGEWTINGNLLKNSNIIGIFTTLLNYGRQITPAEFEKYKNFLKTLPLDISYPVFTKITHDTAKIPAGAMPAHHSSQPFTSQPIVICSCSSSRFNACSTRKEMFRSMSSRVAWHSFRRQRGLHFSGATRALRARLWISAVTAVRLSRFPLRVMNTGPLRMAARWR